jgi:hypothetical protein
MFFISQLSSDPFFLDFSPYNVLEKFWGRVPSEAYRSLFLKGPSVFSTGAQRYQVAFPTRARAIIPELLSEFWVVNPKNELRVQDRDSTAPR